MMNSVRLDVWVTTVGGIAHTTDVYKAGFSKRDVARDVARGVVTRVGRSWICSRSCSRDLKWAAVIGGHLTCVSAAKHSGLWVIDDDRCHIAVRSHSSAQPSREKVRLHYGAGRVPRAKLRAIDPMINVIVEVAQCQSFERAVVVADSAVRGGHVTRSELMRVTASPPSFVRVAEAVSELSDSGIETIPRIRLAAIGIPMRQQVKIAGHRVDGLVGDLLVLQFDGADHLTPAQKQIDARHDNELRLMGYTVLRFTYWDVMDMWHVVEAAVLRAIAQGLHGERHFAA